MSSDLQYVSPKQAARALGVSESSLKRWCDRGLIPVTRTEGGHRQLSVSEVVRFAKSRSYPLVVPDLLGLPASSPHSDLALRRAVGLLTSALLEGEEQRVSQIFFDLYLAQHRLSLILDEVVAVAFQGIGDHWECHRAEVFQERRACEIFFRTVLELRRLQPAPDPLWKAIGGTAEDDHYQISTKLVELVLREQKWDATSLGSAIPFPSLLQAIKTTQPRLFWLSASHIPKTDQFLSNFEKLSDLCLKQGVALVVGGRALTPELRQKMVYSTFCETMQQLEMFASTFRQTEKRARPSRRNQEPKP